jgi:hypothetical protein
LRRGGDTDTFDRVFSEGEGQMLTLTLTTAREVHLLRTILQRTIEQLDKDADAKSDPAAALHRQQAQELREMLSRVEVEPAASPAVAN